MVLMNSFRKLLFSFFVLSLFLISIMSVSAYSAKLEEIPGGHEIDEIQGWSTPGNDFILSADYEDGSYSKLSLLSSGDIILNPSGPYSHPESTLVGLGGDSGRVVVGSYIDFPDESGETVLSQMHDLSTHMYPILIQSGVRLGASSNDPFHVKGLISSYRSILGYSVRESKSPNEASNDIPVTNLLINYPRDDLDSNFQVYKPGGFEGVVLGGPLMVVEDSDGPLSDGTIVVETICTSLYDKDSNCVDVKEIVTTSGGTPSVKTFCPVFAWGTDSSNIRKGRLSYYSLDFFQYDGFLSGYGLSVNQESSNNDEYLGFSSCSENNDNSITFNTPVLIDAGSSAILRPTGEFSYNGFVKVGIKSVDSYSNIYKLYTDGIYSMDALNKVSGYDASAIAFCKEFGLTYVSSAATDLSGSDYVLNYNSGSSTVWSRKSNIDATAINNKDYAWYFSSVTCKRT